MPAVRRHAGGVAIDGGYVYFTSDETDGFVSKVAVDGGASIVVADHRAQPFAVAVDDRCVYWANDADNTIMAAPK